MKRSDVTKKIIELSKELAALDRMEIYEGCWVVDGNGKPRLVHEITTSFEGPQDKEVHLFGLSGSGRWSKNVDFPIPSISDCLAQLRELGFRIHEIKQMKPMSVCDYRVMLKRKERLSTGVAMVYYRFYGDTPHEALLSALLEVVGK